jgi:hypothetical protein
LIKLESAISQQVRINPYGHSGKERKIEEMTLRDAAGEPSALTPRDIGLAKNVVKLLCRWRSCGTLG